MDNYSSSGRIVTRTAPAGGVVTGMAYLIGELLVVSQVTAAAGEKFSGVTFGEATLPKNPAQAWSEGDPLWWDDGNSRLDTTNGAAAFTRVGTAAADQLAADTEGLVRLDGVGRAVG